MLRALALLTVLAAAPALAQPVPFDGGWKNQKFSLFSGNRYGQQGDALTVGSDGSVSILWRALPAAQWPARKARWAWAVDRGVPETDLRLKGGDDRNLALYFVFMPEETAQALGPNPGIRRLLDAPEARVLVYVWGGAHRRGEVLDSPYLGDRGRTVVLRPSGTGAHAEDIDLAADFARAFGGQATALVGLAVSSDSDDTDTDVQARISGPRLE
ncbi:MAG TPA: DUF3047 domain-containing protein [Paracoccaceae bacterium]|nr:DUF3047 domain-containing protein [Paracoccaceae bacterium]